MRHIKETCRLLKKYGRIPWMAIDLLSFCMLALVCAYIYMPGLPWTVVFYTMMLAWEISDVYLYRTRDSYKADLERAEDENILLNGRIRQMEDEISILKVVISTRKGNPFKNGRIVSDRTFALRLRNFIKGTNVCDASGEEEQQYLLNVSERLIKWQTATVRKDSDEYRYLERNGLMPAVSANILEHGTAKSRNNNRRTDSKEKQGGNGHGDKTED